MGGTRRPRALLAAFLALAFAGAACGNNDEGGGEGGTVDVTLQEFAVGAVPSTVGAGSVTFSATNNGPEDEHELVVIRTDLAPDALPTVADGSVDEEGEGIEVIGEIEGIAPDGTGSVTLDLEAGAYVLICNIYDEAEQESHYQEGMRTSLTVG
jgi:uncharacterized cupredoxin-like copper-binding protein